MVILENIPGYDALTAEQKQDFSRILRRFMAAKGTDARNDLVIDHVEVWQKCYNISTRQWGLRGYMVLDPIRNMWW